VSSELNDFLNFLFEKSEGYIYAPSMERETRDWETHFYKWPSDKAGLVSHIETTGRVKDIYISPVVWKFPGKIAPNTFKVSNVAYTEIDGNDFDATIYEPSMRIQSSGPNNQHIYFKLDKPCEDVAELEKINRILTYATDGDPSAWDFSQVLRPPGSKNFKYENTPEVKIVYQSSEILSRSLFKDVQEPKKLIEVIKSAPALIDVIAKYPWAHDDFEFFQKQEIPAGSRSSAMMRLGHVCSEMGMSPEDTYSVLLDADNRWKKYITRSDRDARLVEIINKAFATRSPKATKHRILNSQELWKEDFENIDWIIDEILLPNSIGVIYSQPGMGKTRFSMDLGVHLASGTDYIHWTIPEKKRVLFLSLEMNDYELQLFFKEMVTEKEAAEISDNLIFYAEGVPLDLDKSGGQDTLYQLVREFRPDVIMIDSLGAAVSTDVSANQEVKLFFKFIAKLRKDFGVAIWLIHHGRKATSDNKNPSSLSDMYGSVYIGAEATTVFCLVKTPDSDNNDKGAVLVPVKTRFMKNKETKVLNTDGIKFVSPGKSMSSSPLLRKDNSAI
jgi:hypothetical protein